MPAGLDRLRASRGLRLIGLIAVAALVVGCKASVSSAAVRTLAKLATQSPTAVSTALPVSSAFETGHPQDGCADTGFDEQANFTIGPGRFVQLCTTGDGSSLSYVEDGKERAAAEVSFDGAESYQMDCGYSRGQAICLVQAQDPDGLHYSGRLLALAGDQFHLITEAEGSGKTRSSTLPFILSPLAAQDGSSLDALLLVEGWEFTNLDGAEESAVGYRTAIVDPDLVTVTGCTQPSFDYPDPPAQPNTGPCDEAAW